MRRRMFWDILPESRRAGDSGREPGILLPVEVTVRLSARKGTSLASHLREVRDGQALSPAAACDLLRCDDSLLPELLLAAQAVKEQFRPGVITYSRKVFIPLTNLCRDYCGYCTFRRDPGEAGAHTMTPDEVLAVARQGEMLGCTEALFSLGDKPEALFPEMRDDACAGSGIAVRCIIWKPCASWCCARRSCCRTPIPDC